MSGRSQAQWIESGKDVILAVLRQQHAATIVELEARAADRVFDATVCTTTVQPHILTTARNELEREGRIVAHTEVSRGRTHRMITTYSLPPRYGNATRINRAAARKRLLSVRFESWAHDYAGPIGEAVTNNAMHDCENLSLVSGSTTTVLGRTYPEIDNTAWMVDLESGRPTPILLLIEVKNRREHIYPRNDELLRFLSKAAQIQRDNMDVAVLPVLVARRIHQTTWETGSEHGFLPCRVNRQILPQRSEITAKLVSELRDELGLDDLEIVHPDRTTNYHRGIFDKAIPRRAATYSALWRNNHHQYLP